MAQQVHRKIHQRRQCRTARLRLRGPGKVDLGLAPDSDGAGAQQPAVGRPYRLQCFWRPPVAVSSPPVRHAAQLFRWSAIGAGALHMTGTELSRPATHRPNSPTERRAILQAPLAKKVCECGGRPRFPDTGSISGRRRRHRDPCNRHGAPAALPPAPASGRSAGLLSCQVRTSSCARRSIWHAEKLAENA